MCGIAGILAPAWSTLLEQALRRAVAGIAHRGPDDEGTEIVTGAGGGGPVVALGHRRLAVIDPGPSGHQPMTSADGRWTVVVNGEIYNYRELRSELERAGVSFRTHSDTEVLVEALSAWDTDCLPRLQGMFAVAAVDRVAGRLVLARDPFGIKPLYFACSGQRLFFCSEIPAMLEFPGVGRSADPQRVHEFLTTSSTDRGDGTLLRAVRQVPAAHFVEVPVDRPDRMALRRYWQLRTDAREPCRVEDAAERLRAAFLDSVRMHLRSDVPLGFALSGGIDSSAVVMAARNVLGPAHELHTFSFVPDDARIDEERHVDIVNRAAGRTVAHKFRLAPEDLRRDIDALTWHQGEPFASPVIYAQYRVMQHASEAGVKVVLGGQGSDEMLAGYDRYLAARVASLLRQGRWCRARRVSTMPVTPYPGGRSSLRRAALLQAMPRRAADAAYRLLRPARRHPPWLDWRWFADRGVEPAPAWSARGRNVLRELLAHDLVDSQIPALMRYEDRNAMAFSLENRVPFLTPPLVQMLFALPEDHLLADDGTRKAVFRRAMRGIVPDAILDRRDKIGFSVPSEAWYEALRPWMSERLSLAADLPCLVRSQVEMRRLALLSGKRWGDPTLTWRWVSLASWAERLDVRFD